MKQTPPPQGYLPPPSDAARDRSLITEEQATKTRFSYGIPVVSAVPNSQDNRKRPKPQGRQRLFAVACAVMLFGLAMAVVPSVCHLFDLGKGRFSLEALGKNLGVGFLSQGLPPVNEPFFSTLWVSGETAVESEPPELSSSETVISDGMEDDESFPSEPQETNPQEPEETGPPVGMPAEGLPIVYADMSEWLLGADHIQCDGTWVLPPLSMEKTFLPAGKAVLIVHSHPYATYGDGGDTVKSGIDGWAVAVPEDGSYPDKGVVALGDRLTTLLRLRGIQVIHALLPTEKIPSHMDTYERTAALVDALCASHPEIGLVIDLRRGADRLPDGSLLRTLGSYGDTNTAQVRPVVDALRPNDQWHRDLAAAVALRRLLYQASPTLSRPVYLTNGAGLSADDEPLLLTLEFGTAGNTFEEAAVLLVPVADAIADLLS